MIVRGKLNLLKPVITGTTGRKFRDREIFALRSKVQNIDFGRTAVKNTNWSHHGRKYRIGFFGRRVAKTGQKSRRKTLHTTGAKLRGKIFAPGQNFLILLIWSPRSKVLNQNFWS